MRQRFGQAVHGHFREVFYDGIEEGFLALGNLGRQDMQHLLRGYLIIEMQEPAISIHILVSILGNFGVCFRTQAELSESILFLRVWLLYPGIFTVRVYDEEGYLPVKDFFDQNS